MSNQTASAAELASNNAPSIGEKSLQIDDSTTLEGMSAKGEDRHTIVAVVDWKDEDIVYPDGGFRAWLIVAGVRSHRFPLIFREQG
jgi:hypothetical protein